MNVAFGQKKSSQRSMNSSANFCWTTKSMSFWQVFWLTDQPPATPSRSLQNWAVKQWFIAAFVPAYSAGPTLRNLTVFPFHPLTWGHLKVILSLI